MENKRTFEQGLEELEALVRALESGEMPLEESFQAFERGMRLKKELQELLDEGDRRIRVLTGEGDRPLAGEEEA